MSSNDEDNHRQIAAMQNDADDVSTPAAAAAHTAMGFVIFPHQHDVPVALIMHSPSNIIVNCSMEDAINDLNQLYHLAVCGPKLHSMLTGDRRRRDTILLMLLLMLVYQKKQISSEHCVQPSTCAQRQSLKSTGSNHMTTISTPGRTSPSKSN